MQIIRRGLQIGQAVKNVQRLRQILAVFAKHGFVDVVERMRLTKFLPKRLRAFAASEADFSMAQRLRISFEELGPTFVKFGQLLSTRSDLLPDAFIEELVKLQDDVHALPFEVVRSSVERELGRGLDEAYASFSPVPLGSASISQVHEAVLRSGDKVVVKVQRPEIARTIETDISLLAFLAGLLEKYVPESRVISPRIVVNELFRTLSYELDFVVEANNMTKMAENMVAFPDIVIPRVHKALSTQRVLTLEKLEGIRVNDLRAMDEAGIDRKRVVELGARAFFKSVMIDGLFHGDLHGGNLFILPGNRLGVIDFGIVGRLSERSRDQLANMVVALLTEDYETLCYEYAEIGGGGASIDFEGFQREVRNTLSPYMGLPLADLNLGRILIEGTRIATQYHINVPGDWMIVFKAILTLEGMGRTLDPGFDMLAMGREMAGDLVRRRYSVERIARDLGWMARDAASLLQILPRQIRWMLRKFNSNDFAFEIKSPELRELSSRLEASGRRSSLSLLAASLMLAGAIALRSPAGRMIAGIPLPSAALFALGIAFLVRLLVQF